MRNSFPQRYQPVKRMRKYLLSFFVITVFSGYVFFKNFTAAAPLPLSSQLGDVTIPSSSVNVNGESSTQTAQADPPPPTSDSPTPAPTPPPANNPTPNNNPAPTQAVPSRTTTGIYKNGAYTGSAADAYYGYIQVRAIISGGKITDVQFLDYPQDRGTSIMINQQAMPYLRAEAIAVQSANVNIVSGATDSSMAFQQSLATALAQARN